MRVWCNADGNARVTAVATAVVAGVVAALLTFVSAVSPVNPSAAALPELGPDMNPSDTGSITVHGVLRPNRGGTSGIIGAPSDGRQDTAVEDQINANKGNMAAMNGLTYRLYRLNTDLVERGREPADPNDPNAVPAIRPIESQLDLNVLLPDYAALASFLNTYAEPKTALQCAVGGMVADNGCVTTDGVVFGAEQKGVAHWNDLAFGYYLLVQDEGDRIVRDAQGGVVSGLVNELIAPTLIPLPRKDGAGTPIKDVHVYPKVTEATTVTKSIVGENHVYGYEDANHPDDESAIAHTIRWQIKVPLSADMVNPNGLTARELKLTDELNTDAQGGRLDLSGGTDALNATVTVRKLDGSALDGKNLLEEDATFPSGQPTGYRRASVSLSDRGTLTFEVPEYGLRPALLDEEAMYLLFEFSTPISQKALKVNRIENGALPAGASIPNEATLTYLSALNFAQQAQRSAPMKAYVGQITVVNLYAKDRATKLYGGEFGLALSREDAEAGRYIARVTTEGDVTVLDPAPVESGDGRKAPKSAGMRTALHGGTGIEGAPNAAELTFTALSGARNYWVKQTKAPICPSGRECVLVEEPMQVGVSGQVAAEGEGEVGSGAAMISDGDDMNAAVSSKCSTGGRAAPSSAGWETSPADGSGIIVCAPFYNDEPASSGGDGNKPVNPQPPTPDGPGADKPGTGPDAGGTIGKIVDDLANSGANVWMPAVGALLLAGLLLMVVARRRAEEGASEKSAGSTDIAGGAA